MDVAQLIFKKEINASNVVYEKSQNKVSFFCQIHLERMFAVNVLLLIRNIIMKEYLIYLSNKLIKYMICSMNQKIILMPLKKILMN